MPVARLRLLPLLLLLATAPATRAAAEVLYATEFGPPLFASQQPIVGVDGWLAGWSQTGGFITYELVEPMGLWLAENNLPDPNRSAIGRPVAVPADRPTTLRLLLLPAQLRRIASSAWASGSARASTARWSAAPRSTPRETYGSLRTSRD